jgi:hypothetical protein
MLSTSRETTNARMPRTTALEILLRPIEAVVVATASTRLRAPPLFVIGPPRGGTTLVGLHIFNTFEFAYFPNVSKLHRKTPYMRARLARSHGAWAPSYDNAYGNVNGDLALSDGWDIFQRWFEPYSESAREHAANARGLVKLAARFEQLFDAPFFAKNNANSMRVGALAELFPRALFVHVTRGYPEAASSLLEARRRHGVALNRWWSAAPPQMLGRKFASELEQVAATLWGLDRYIEDQLARLPDERWTSVDYEAFCAYPNEIIDWIAARYASAGVALRRRAGERPDRFDASRLEAERRAELEVALAPILARLEREDASLAVHDAGEQ